MFTLRLLGTAMIEGPAGPLEGRIAQRRQIALLSFLALQDVPVRRDRVVSVFWPETSDARARHSLSDALYVIRRFLGEDSVRAVGDDVQLGSRVSSDVKEFRTLAGQGLFAEAAAVYGGPLLDGFHLGGAPEFEQWLEHERAELAGSLLAVLETLARKHEEARDYAAAVRWWRRAAGLDPWNSRIAMCFSACQLSAGEPVAAMRSATDHVALLDAELGMKPPPEFLAYIGTLGVPSPHEPIGAGAATHLKRTADATGVSGAGATSVAEASAKAITKSEPISSVVMAGVGRTRAGVTRMRYVARVVAVLAASSVAVWLMNGEDRSGAVTSSIDPTLVLVLPFRDSGADPQLAYLRHGMVELLTLKLAGEGGTLRAVPAGHTLQALRTTASLEGADLPEAAALSLARRLGAGRLLQGSVIGGQGNVVLTAVLRDEAGQEIGRVSVAGRDQDLPDLVDRLAAELLTRNAGVEEDRLVDLTSRSLPALHTFLAARSAHRRGDYEVALHEYSRALDLDSTFALAGLGILSVSGWVGGSAAREARGRFAAFRFIDRLSERDRVGALGRLNGERTGPVTGRLRIEELGVALRRWPDHARLWYLRGDYFMHNGAAMLAGGAATEARLHFEEAIRLDEDFHEPIHHLAEVLASTGDTAALRRLATKQLARTPTGPIADYLRWRSYHTLRDTIFSPPPLASMDVDATLRWIGIIAQDAGFAMEDGVEAVLIRAGRAGVADQRLERTLGVFAWALNRGRRDDALEALQSLEDIQPDPDYIRRMAVLTAMYADGDMVHAARAARELEASGAEGAVGELNRCIAQQWQLRLEPHSVERPRILSDEAAMSADSRPLAVERRLCALVRDAQWLAHAADGEAPAAINRLDRLLDLAPIIGLVDGGQSEFVHLALARLHESAGRSNAALRALERRAFYNGWQPYLAATLHTEGRIAATVGDTARAIRAWQHYLKFRTDPDPTLRAEREAVESALLQLTEQR